MVAVPRPSGQATGTGERAVVAANAFGEVVGVVADVDGSVVGAGPGSSGKVAVAGVGAVRAARGRQVVVADVDRGVVIRASVAGLAAGDGEGVGALSLGHITRAAAGIGVCAAALGDRQPILAGGSVGGGVALMDQRIPVE